MSEGGLRLRRAIGLAAHSASSVDRAGGVGGTLSRLQAMHREERRARWVKH